MHQSLVRPALIDGKRKLADFGPVGVGTAVVLQVDGVQYASITLVACKVRRDGGTKTRVKSAGSEFQCGGVFADGKVRAVKFEE